MVLIASPRLWERRMSKATLNGAQFVIILFEALLIVGRRCCLPEKTLFSTLVYMTRCTHDRRFVALPRPTFVAVMSPSNRRNCALLPPSQALGKRSGLHVDVSSTEAQLHQ